MTFTKEQKQLIYEQYIGYDGSSRESVTYACQYAIDHFAPSVEESVNAEREKILGVVCDVLAYWPADLPMLSGSNNVINCIRERLEPKNTPEERVTIRPHPDNSAMWLVWLDNNMCYFSNSPMCSKDAETFRRGLIEELKEQEVK